jgi:Ala-tRNA(Pro) deacylase
MTIAKRLEDHLKKRSLKHSLVTHPPTGSSMETAEAAHVPGDALAKGVVLKDDAGLLLVVVPSDYHVELDTLNAQLDRSLAFVSEDELADVFPDCARGAVPVVGEAYGVETIWDPEASLGQQEHVYFEAGDHATLVKMNGEHFHELMSGAERVHFSHHI